MKHVKDYSEYLKEEWSIEHSSANRYTQYTFDNAEFKMFVSKTATNNVLDITIHQAMYIESFGMDMVDAITDFITNNTDHSSEYYRLSFMFETEFGKAEYIDHIISAFNDSGYEAVQGSFHNEVKVLINPK